MQNVDTTWICGLYICVHVVYTSIEWLKALYIVPTLAVAFRLVQIPMGCLMSRLDTTGREAEDVVHPMASTEQDLHQSWNLCSWRKGWQSCESVSQAKAVSNSRQHAAECKSHHCQQLYAAKACMINLETCQLLSWFMLPLASGPLKELQAGMLTWQAKANDVHVC